MSIIILAPYAGVILIVDKGLSLALGLEDEILKPIKSPNSATLDQPGALRRVFNQRALCNDNFHDRSATIGVTGAAVRFRA
ncbi:MAG: hypothetical protein IT547_18945 [Hyphomonadaceae bacterium]|nr:hypothetical protein [Hyphomonadaceae bacterium]